MLSVQVSPETFHKTTHGSIVGQIWIDVGERAFPSPAWIDFPVVIMGWWLENISTLCSGWKTGSKCLFMDGPFYFEISVQAKDRWLLRFLESRRDREEYLFEASSDSQSVVTAMLQAANLVIRTCHEKSWNSSDLDALESHYIPLSRISRGKGNGSAAIPPKREV